MARYLESKPPNDKIPSEYYRIFKSILATATNYNAAISDHNRLMTLYARFADSESISSEEALKINSEVRNVLKSYLSLTSERTSEGEYAPGEDLREVISELEAELLRLRTNPALEKKVAKLEEEVRKVRFASVVGENEGKEQEDILKKYKASEKRLFVIMPFSPLFDDVWKGAIERACQSEDLACLRVDQISLSTWITEDIEKCIE